MRLLIIGGYGPFGGRLSRLLCTAPSLILLIAGRNPTKAAAFCAALPAGAAREPCVFDRDGDVERQLLAIAPAVVVDATGPFQAYGTDPYRVVKAAIACNLDYLDLADGAEFVRGITQFDEAAQRAHVFVLSGVSTLPALSSAVVRHLTHDLESVDSINAGIAPSPFAGVGLNVIRDITGYAGQPIRLRRHGHADISYGLVESEPYSIAPPGYVPLTRRQFSLVDVPDLRLFVEVWPGVKTVWFGAGPVSAVLHALLRVLARMVKWKLVPALSPFAVVIFRTANVVRWGEHRGGMFIAVRGRRHDGRHVDRSWHLVAEGDDGPFIPSMGIAALMTNLLDGARPQDGARAATRELELSDYEKLFAARDIFTGVRHTSEHDEQTLYARLLGDAFTRLPSALRLFHGRAAKIFVTGKANVQHGRGLLAQLIVGLFGFPKAVNGTQVSVTVERTGEHERWTRNFSGRKFASEQFAGRGGFENLLCERFGPFVFGIALVSDSDRLSFVVRHWRFFGIPLPNALAPSGDSFEFEREGRFHFHVEMRAPIVGLIVRYAGHLE